MARRVKVDRRKLREPDEFISTTTRVYRWVAARRDIAIAVMVGLVAMALALRGIEAYHESTTRSVQNLLYQATKLYLSSDGSAEDLAKALEGYETVLRDYPCWASASAAGILKGNILFKQGKYGEAVRAYEHVLRSMAVDNPLRELVVLSLAYSYHEAGDRARAIAEIEALLKDTEAVLKDYASIALGDWYREEGDLERAVELYSSVQQGFPDTPAAEEARRRLGMVAAKER